jgi:asparagine synthase (glutamine-hydrolysing)
MCGIAGYIGNKINFPNQTKINRCVEFLKRRGPDNNGISRFHKNKKNLLLIHTRLSIIDLNENSNQPFSDEEGIIVFNGMIYNFLELRKLLKKKRIKLNTFSDTEVLLKLLNIYKEKTFKMLDGMWSISYYNFKDSNLILSRDRFGQKPLYYQLLKDSFFFSNSIAALNSLTQKKLKFNKRKVRDLLTYPDKSYGIDTNTLFDGVYQFPAGSYLKIDLNKKSKIKFKKYWNLKIRKNNFSFKKACKEFKKLFISSMRNYVISDVKNSSLVSGGLDSNAIVSQANKISKISGYSLISTNKKYDERPRIKDSERYNKFKTKFISSKSNNSFKLLKDIINDSYNILLTPTALGLALLCKKIKKEGNRVLLSGIGGDELFSGYYINYLSHIISYKGKKKYEEKINFWDKNIKKFIRNKNLKNFEKSNESYNRYNLNFYTEGKAILKNYLKKPSNIKVKKCSKDIFYNNMLQNIFFQSIPSQLLQSDLVTMFFSIELRAPFLSHKFFDFVYKLDKDYFMYKGQPKSLQRNAMKKYYPKSIYNDYEKVGFYSPFKSFFKKQDMKSIKFYLKNCKVLKEFLKNKNFAYLINKKNNLITHEESKFLFICLNIAVLEKSVMSKANV